MFGGSIVALVTPMDRDGGLDMAALDRLLTFHLEEQTGGIVIGGTTGESPTLTGDELEVLVRAAVRKADGKIPVIAGNGTNSTKASQALSQRVAGAGADACLVATPYYNKPRQRGLTEHYTAIAEAVDVPVIKYNVPGRTGCDMTSETAVRLAEHPNICGIKEATGDIDRGRAFVANTGEDFVLLRGDDITARALMAVGAKGVISVTANVAPALMHAMCEAATQNDRDTAKSIDDKLVKLHDALFAEANPIPVKWALTQMGLIDGGIRLPLTELGPEYHDAVRSALNATGIRLQ